MNRIQRTTQILPELCEHEAVQLCVEHSALVVRLYEPGQCNPFSAGAEWEEDIVWVDEQYDATADAYFECLSCHSRWDAEQDPKTGELTRGDRQPYPFAMPGHRFAGDNS